MAALGGEESGAGCTGWAEGGGAQYCRSEGRQVCHCCKKTFREQEEVVEIVV